MWVYQTNDNINDDSKKEDLEKEFYESPPIEMNSKPSRNQHKNINANDGKRLCEKS